MSEHWIQNAIKKPGSFTVQAKRAGESTQSFAADVKSNPEDYNAKTRKRAALARTLANLRG